jgi:hypothetical protein
MDPQVAAFKDNVDAWIKQIRREFSELSDLPAIVQENTENIQHNYELIYELRDEIEELKQEINALKLIQIIALKNRQMEEAQASVESVDKVKLT